jgi:hypothetical protein
MARIAGNLINAIEGCLRQYAPRWNELGYYTTEITLPGIYHRTKCYDPSLYRLKFTVANLICLHTSPSHRLAKNSDLMLFCFIISEFTTHALRVC